MLVGVALVAVVCACVVNARKRAKEEDELIALVQPSPGVVYLRGSGPAWLDLFGADRLRRRLVGVYIRDVAPSQANPWQVKVVPWNEMELFSFTVRSYRR